MSNPVLQILGRRLRLGVIGGGPGSFIGEVHRAAARLDDRYEIVAGVLSSDPARARERGVAIGLPADRSYESVDALFTSEAAREDGIDVVAIMTPNDSHYDYCCKAMASGVHVICDKPLTNDVDEALDLVSRVEATGTIFCLTHNYTGYPMVRQARAMVAEGLLGAIRLVQAEYVQGGLARSDEDIDFGARPWRLNPAVGGPSLVLGDIGTHAHHLACYVTGAGLSEIAADVGTVVPGRRVHDIAGALLRFEDGARGMLWATQAASGIENRIHLRVSGSLGTVDWYQEDPNVLPFAPLDGPAQVLTRNGPGVLPACMRASRIAKGHPEGFHEAFANLYSDAAEAIAARLSGAPADPLALDFPGVRDGARGVKFVAAAIASSNANGAWTDCSLG